MLLSRVAAIKACLPGETVTPLQKKAKSKELCLRLYGKDRQHGDRSTISAVQNEVELARHS